MFCIELSRTNRRVGSRNIIHKHGQQLGQSDQVINGTFKRMVQIREVIKLADEKDVTGLGSEKYVFVET